MYSDTRLKEKTAIITGASGGIGIAIAKELAKMNANLVLTSRHKEGLDRLQKDLTSEEIGGNVITVPADITSEHDRNFLMETTLAEFEQMNVLVNCAGIYCTAPLEEVEENDLEKSMLVNFIGPVMLTKLVYQKMKEQRNGKIINIGSLSGLRGWQGGIPYVSSKFALTGFTQCLALEAAPYNIQVNAVAPGFVNTEMGHTAIAAKAAREGVEFSDMRYRVEQELPSGRISNPEEVAAVVAFLSSHAADNIIGSVIKISGGDLLG